MSPRGQTAVRRLATLEHITLEERAVDEEIVAPVDELEATVELEDDLGDAQGTQQYSRPC